MSWDVRFYWERFSSSDFIEIFAKILGRYPDKKYNVWDFESFYSVQIRMAYKTTITVLWKYLSVSGDVLMACKSLIYRVPTNPVC